MAVVAGEDWSIFGRVMGVNWGIDDNANVNNTLWGEAMALGIETAWLHNYNWVI